MRLIVTLAAAAIVAVAAGCSSSRPADEMRCAACTDAASPAPADACMKDSVCTMCHPAKCASCGGKKESGHACPHLKQCADCGAQHQCANRCPTCKKEKSVCPDCGK